MRQPTTADVAGFLDRLAPPSLAETWDNVGLLLGDPAATPAWVAVTLDAGFFLAGRDFRRGGLLVTHHPVPFRPLGRLLATDPTSSLLIDLARRDISLYAAHTSFDYAPEGLSQALALALGLDRAGLRPLAPAGRDDYVKLVVFVPATHSAGVRAALAEAGAGFIGNYSDTAFAAPGRGFFRPREGASPYTGTAGVLEEVAEERVETILPARLLGPTVAKMLEAHPYEEPAYDVYPLLGAPPVTRSELLTGAGRVGDLAEAVPLEGFVADVEKALGLEAGTARVIGAGGAAGAARAIDAPPAAGTASSARVRRVAVCPGAGGSLLGAAKAAGASVYVTGELTHHHAIEACQLGLSVIEAGHYATEALFVPLVAARLRKYFASQGIPLEVSEVPRPLDWSLR